MLPVYIGYDAREAAAYEVARKSIQRHASQPVSVMPVDAAELYRRRLLWRPVEMTGDRMRDHLSDAEQSTEFATSRFLVPFMQRSGWALFVDCDVVCLGDIAELFALADPKYAVMVVKHGDHALSQTKMDGRAQAGYRRKNWSSVVLWNCEHRGNMRLTLEIVNGWRGSQLHQFCWLADEEIGELPAQWNWLCGVTPKPDEVKLAHMTLGGPWFPGWRGSEFDAIWHEARSDSGRR